MEHYNKDLISKKTKKFDKDKRAFNSNAYIWGFLNLDAPGLRFLPQKEIVRPISAPRELTLILSLLFSHRRKVQTQGSTMQMRNAHKRAGMTGGGGGSGMDSRMTADKKNKIQTGGGSAHAEKIHQATGRVFSNLDPML